MDSPSRIPSISSRQPQVFLSPCRSRRKNSTEYSTSPEFEFWMVRNPSFPQPNQLSADELFVDGILLPLHLLPLRNHHPPEPQPDPEPPNSAPASDGAEPITETSTTQNITAEPSNTTLTASKRWKDIIFKKAEPKKQLEDNNKDKELKQKEKKREKKAQSGGVSSAATELNINIWPFSRSRSAGNNGSRPSRMSPGPSATRKVSSAPCSRSNSAGESKSRKWPSSPSRPGVHLGRSSPVWQVRRGSSGQKISYSESVGRSAEKTTTLKRESVEYRRGRTVSGAGNKAKVLNLNVPMCIGYRHHLGCRTDENGATAVGGGGGGGNGGGRGNGSMNGGGNIFNLRSFFTKKVY